jgi:nucleotide-binding universal stress UspA family protein
MTTGREMDAPMDIKKLLFVTKFDDLCFDALQSLLVLRKAALDHVVFINVIERDKVSMHRGVGYEKREEIRLRETANIRFIDWAEYLFEQGMEVGVYIVVGNLVGQAFEAACKEEADLIVVGRSRKGLMEQLYSGSDVTELLRRSIVPVLVYKPLPDKVKVPDKPFERVLLAVDWSAASMTAVDYLSRLGAVIDQVHVIHVARPKDLKGDTSMTVQALRKKVRAKLEAVCERLEAAGLNARSHVYIGDPIEEIEKAARECQATMIAMGSSGKSEWVERWLGSTPRALAEKSDLPTLIFPPPRSK